MSEMGVFWEHLEHTWKRLKLIDFFLNVESVNY